MQGKRQLTLALGRRPFQRGRGLWPGARPRWGLGRGADPNTHSLAPRLVQAWRLVGCLLSRAGACSPGTHGHLAWLWGEDTRFPRGQLAPKAWKVPSSEGSTASTPPAVSYPQEGADARASEGRAGCLRAATAPLALALPQPRCRHSSSCSSSSEPEGPWRTSSYHLLVRVFIWMRPWCRSSCVSLRVKKGFRYLASSHMKPLRSCRLT